MASKAPAFQFYPGDWQRDVALRSCSIGARGLWIEMICIMHQAEPYGHLVINGKPIDATELARLIGASRPEVVKLMADLESKGVYSVEDGVIVSRRMIRDEAFRRTRAACGKLGGNPKLSVKVDVDADLKVGSKLGLTPSSSSSSSSSRREERPPISPPQTASESDPAPNPPPHLHVLVKGGRHPPSKPSLLEDAAFLDAWTTWLEHRKAKNTKPTPHAIDLQLRQLESMTHERRIAALEHSTRNGYTGLFEPSAGSGPGRVRADRATREATGEV